MRNSCFSMPWPYLEAQKGLLKNIIIIFWVGWACSQCFAQPGILFLFSGSIFFFFLLWCSTCVFLPAKVHFVAKHPFERRGWKWHLYHFQHLPISFLFFKFKFLFFHLEGMNPAPACTSACTPYCLYRVAMSQPCSARKTWSQSSQNEHPNF